MNFVSSDSLVFSVSTLTDSQSTEAVGGAGVDVCLPFVDTFSENNSLDKLSSSSESLSRINSTFSDSFSQSRLNAADISFSLNAQKHVVPKPKSFDCSLCGREFKRQTSLIVHKRTHNGLKPYQCMICGKTFSQSCNVRRHVESHKVFPHNVVKLNSFCSLSEDAHCSSPSTVVDVERCIVKPNITEEVNQMDSSIAFSCFYCSNWFDCAKCRKRHVASIHRNQKVFQCSLRNCRRLVGTLEEYMQHMNAHSSELRYRCPICDKDFKTLLEVGVHQAVHAFKKETRNLTESLTFRCFVCSDVFTCLKSLERHQSNTSHNFKCKFCSRCYSSERQRRRHVKFAHSSVNREKLTCNVCSKSFNFGYTYKIHLARHNEPQNRHKCDKCEKLFSRRDVMLRHSTSVHSNLNPFTCSFAGCAKIFKRADRLKAHLLTHNSSNRKFRCSKCGKSFLRQNALNLHDSSVHLKNYRLHCNFCQKGFNRPDALRKHNAKCTIKC